MARWLDDRSKSEALRILKWLFHDVFERNAEGGVNLHSWGEPETSSSLLVSRLSLHCDITPRTAQTLVRRALIDSFKADPTSPSRFVEALSGLESSFLRKPLEGFVLLTSLSARDLHDFPTIRLDGATFTFSRFPPPRFGTPDLVVRHRWNDKRFFSRTAVRVHVRARDPMDAADLALQRLELLRSFWNLGLHRGIWSIRMGDDVPPINKIRLGPIHTVHYPDGSSARDSFWYEPDFREGEFTETLGEEKKGKLREMETWCRTRLRRVPDRRKVEGLWIRYCQALDQRNRANAFLQTWAILEDLTGNPSRYDQLIRRASYLYSDRWYVRLQLEEMRRRRNELVHKGSNEEHPERMTFVLKGIVEHYLLFMLRNPKIVGSPQALAAFLAQPTDVGARAQQMRRLQLAADVMKR